MMLEIVFGADEDSTDEHAFDRESPVDALAHEYATTDMHIHEYEARLEDVLQSEANSDHDCPNCGADMVRRDGPYGEFWACSQYPACTATALVDD